jgi:hypothetical protein
MIQWQVNFNIGGRKYFPFQYYNIDVMRHLSRDKDIWVRWDV